jgi:PadR family transcriptional regulator PadR
MLRRRRLSPQTLRVYDALLASPTRWRYGYDLSRETGLRSGTLYPMLIRMADRGLLETGWQDPDRPGPPPRHAYRLTLEGERVAGAELSAAAGRRAVPHPRPRLGGAR